MNTGAFFDLDDTLVSGTAGLRFVRFLRKRHSIPLKLSMVLPIIKTMYDFLRDDAPKYIQDFDVLWALMMKGIKQKNVSDMAKHYAPMEINNIHKVLFDEIEQHKRSGRKLFLISASPDELVVEIGRLLGFDYAIGTKLAVKKGVYTGLVKKPYLSGEDRVLIVKNLAKTFKVSLKDSYAYGNGENDIGVLSLVGNPVAVNPKDELKPLAKNKGWKVLDTNKL